jgi:Tannase and feruloyl esterase
MDRIVVARITACAATAGLVAVAMAASVQSAGATCESLTSFKIPNVTITSAQTVPAGTFMPPRGGGQSQAFKSLPPFCRVAATLTPSRDSDIKVEVWLPVVGWNQKYEAVGNGAWAGSMSYGDMAEGLKRGFATSSTDTGHSGAGADWAINHREKVIDYAYRSEHEMVVTAKAVVTTFYGSTPKQSYFSGCSTGGRQALVEAEKYPADFNGIIAGAAANPKAGLDAWRVWIAQAMFKDKNSIVPPAQLPMIHRAVLAQCDAIDGVKDGLIENPLKCAFDPATLKCQGSAGPDCLTAAQVEAVRTIMSPAKDRRTSELIFPTYSLGAELGWSRMLTGPDAYDRALEQYRFMVYNDPDWNWRTFDLERDVEKSRKAHDGVFAAVNPDLSAFAQRGGKLLTYHGWSDPNIAAEASVNFYNTTTVATKPPANSRNWVRLFMVPGMGHCSGGEGPDSFDMLTPLDRWVDGGEVPTRIVASRIRNGRVDMTRPLCPYPQVAHYRGSGDTNEETNFVCRE